jgi:hypothetical protein
LTGTPAFVDFNNESRERVTERDDESERARERKRKRQRERETERKNIVADAL